MIEIRPARESDLDWLVGELREFDKFYGTKKKLFGEEAYVRETTLQIMQQHVFLTACEGTNKIGFLAGLNKPHFYNPQILVLTQLFWWVMPDYRHTIAAHMLIDEFVRWGKVNSDWITLSISAKTLLSPRSLLKKGFIESDRSYIMEIE